MPENKASSKLEKEKKIAKKKLKSMMQSKKRVQAILKVIDVSVANQLLGGSASAARQRRGAEVIGDTKKDLYTTSGSFKGFKDTLKRRYKKVAKPR